MKSAALGAFATLLGYLATNLYQDHYLLASYCLGFIAAIMMLFSLFALRKEKNADKRPRLIVRKVLMKPYLDPLSPLEPGKPLRVAWSLVNLGDSPCEITDGNSEIIADTIPFDPRSRYGKSDSFLLGKKFPPGHEEPLETTADTIDFKGNPVRNALREQKKAIYFYGLITYKEDAGRLRRTAYCRMYNPETHEFHPVDNTDFEYAD